LLFVKLEKSERKKFQFLYLCGLSGVVKGITKDMGAPPLPMELVGEGVEGVFGGMLKV